MRGGSRVSRRPWHRLGMGLWDRIVGGSGAGERGEGLREWLSRLLHAGVEEVYYYRDPLHLLTTLTLLAKPRVFFQVFPNPLDGAIHGLSYVWGATIHDLPAAPPGKVQELGGLGRLFKQALKIHGIGESKLVLLADPHEPTGSHLGNEVLEVLSGQTGGSLVVIDITHRLAYEPEAAHSYPRDTVLIAEVPALDDGERVWVTAVRGPRRIIEGLEMLSPLNEEAPRAPVSWEAYVEGATRMGEILRERARTLPQGLQHPRPFIALPREAIGTLPKGWRVVNDEHYAGYVSALGLVLLEALV